MILLKPYQNCIKDSGTTSIGKNLSNLHELIYLNINLYS